MILLAIDPGPVKSAYVELGGYVDPPEIMRYGHIDNFELIKKLNSFCNTHLALEMVASYGMPVGSEVFETVYWIGRFADRMSLHYPEENIVRIKRKEVCLHICNSPRANDGTIRQALIDLYGGKDKSIGGSKCHACKGKGRTGREKNGCYTCGGSGWECPPGPLKGISGDVWQALALGLTYLDTVKPSGQCLEEHDKSSQ